MIAASLADVWHLIKLPDFYHFWSKLQKAEEEKGMAERTEIVKWSFKDGTVLDVKMEEHSVRKTCYIKRKATCKSANDKAPAD